MPQCLLTGGAGFFGGILRRRCLERGYGCLSADILSDPDAGPGVETRQVDLADAVATQELFRGRHYDVVFHCAAMLAHGVKDQRRLWASNVDGTRNLARAAAESGCRKFIFISSNCLWGSPFGRPVREEDIPAPIEVYGRSKWEGEKALEPFQSAMECVVLRVPTIIDEGRLGLLAILFQFIDENRTVWMVGGGQNRYQFIYGPDLADACLLAAEKPCRGVFNVGSDDVPTLRETFAYVIRESGSCSRIRALPRGPALAVMWAAHYLHISPLGPYHARMIAESFAFDTGRIKRDLGWQPTLTNNAMLLRAHRYYHEHRQEIESRKDASAHRSAAHLGVIRLLKWIS
jgi:nucleoside-diphosphate-sugar epimerase